jgi:hypothetical protein
MNCCIGIVDDREIHSLSARVREPPRSSLTAGSRLARFSRRSLADFAIITVECNLAQCKNLIFLLQIPLSLSRIYRNMRAANLFPSILFIVLLSKILS